MEVKWSPDLLGCGFIKRGRICVHAQVGACKHTAKKAAVHKPERELSPGAKSVSTMIRASKPPDV